MRYRELGRTGMLLSELGIGPMRLNGRGHDNAARCLNLALDLGINYIDVARAYGEAEELTGPAVTHRRDEFYLGSKSNKRTATEARAELETSLRNLHTDHLDLWQLHFVNRDADLDAILAPGGALEAAVRAREEGLVRHIGITGHNPEVLARGLETGQFETVQFILSLGQPHTARALLPLARERGIGTLAMKVLNIGALAPVKTAFDYARAFGPNVCVIGMATPEQVAENIALFDRVPTAEEEAAALRTGIVLGDLGCRRCFACTPCPADVPLPVLMNLATARARGPLPPEGERQWQDAAAKAARCADCAECRDLVLCEARCPYHLAIRAHVRAAAESAR